MNGKEAIKVTEKEEQYDLILMDMMMPIMNGFDAMQALRQTEALKETPIIALTAMAITKDKDKCLQYGASDYLSKPLNEEKLIAIIQSWIS